jgi:hypothetical protein
VRTNRDIIFVNEVEEIFWAKNLNYLK